MDPEVSEKVGRLGHRSLGAIRIAESILRSIFGEFKHDLRSIAGVDASNLV